MDDNVATPWWRTALMILAGLAGLLALSGLAMALILAVARFLDTGGARTTDAPAAYYGAPPPLPSAQQNARTRMPQPYALQSWPDTPSRRTGTSAPRGGGRAAQKEKAAPDVPVGLSVEQYQAKVAAGGKVYLPNPQGECGLGGEGSSRSLEECFAARAAR